MPNQPESPQHPRSSTAQDHQGSSIAIDPAKATESNKDRLQDDTHQKALSGATPRSMPWPEAATMRPSPQKKPAARPTKPNLVDEWPAAIQEAEPAFPSTVTSSVDKQFRTPNTPTQGRKPDPGLPSNHGEGWAPNSRTPQQGLTPREPEQAPQPIAEPGPETLIPTTLQYPPRAKESGLRPYTPIAPPPSNATLPLPISHEWANPSSEPHLGNPGNVFVRKTQPSVERMPPSPPANPLASANSLPSASPASTPAMPEPPQTTPHKSPPPSRFKTLLHTPGPEVPAPKTPFFSEPTSIPAHSNLENQWETVLPDRQNPIASNPTSYTSIPTTQGRETGNGSQSTHPIVPSPGSAAIPAHEPLLTPLQAPETTMTPHPTTIPPSDRQFGIGAGELHEPQKAVTSTAPESGHQQNDQLTFAPISPTSHEPHWQSSSGPSVRHSTSPSLDEEWVASQQEGQEEEHTMGVASKTPPGSEPNTPLGNPHQPNNFAFPNDWAPETRQQSSSPNKSTSPPPMESRGPGFQPPSPDISRQQGPLPRRSEVATDGVPTTKGPTSHVVQAWPSARSGKDSTRTRSVQRTLDTEGWDKDVSVAASAAQGTVTKALQAASDVTSALGTGYLDPDDSEELEFAPLRLRHPVFTGDGSTLFGIFTRNTVWTILTFGIYSFWGRIHIRRYLHSQTKFAGARFAFHGTGSELLMGWIKALLAFGIPFLGIKYVSSQHAEAVWQWSLDGLTGLLVLCFIPIAIVGSHRYRMSRTSWRGIRFSFRRSITGFTILYLKGLLLSLVTLGIYYPAFEHSRRGFLTSGTHFGNQAFGFDGPPQVLGQLYFNAFRRLVLTLVIAEVFLLTASFLTTRLRPEQVVDLVFLLSVGTGAMIIPILLGLWFWFQAAKQRYMWNHTTFGQSRFRATMKGRHLFELKCTNLILLMGSLGLAWPWVRKRNLQFLYYHLGFKGPLKLKYIMQQANSASPMGEELAGFFDAGFEM